MPSISRMLFKAWSVIFLLSVTYAMDFNTVIYSHTREMILTTSMQDKITDYHIGNSIAGIRATDGVRAPFYTGALRIFDMSLSSSESFMSIGFVTGDEGGRGLQILDTNNFPVRELGSYLGATWHPTNDWIAFIAGDTADDTCKMNYEGVGIYDAKNNVLKMLDTRVSDIQWASFDGRLYMDLVDEDASKMVSFEPETGLIVDVPFKGIDFSPTGEYYIAQSDHSDITVYISKSNENITGEFPYFQKMAYTGTFLFWVDDESFLFDGVLDQYILLNVISGSMRRIPSLPISKGNDGSTLVMVDKELEIQKRAIRSFPEVTIDELIDDAYRR